MDTLAAHRIHIQCGDGMVGQFKQVGGLSARRGTGIQHAQVVPLRQGLQQQGRCQLGRRVLHRNPAFGKPRQLLYRTGLGKRDTVRAVEDALDTRRTQMLLQIVPRRQMADVDAQGQRRRLQGLMHDVAGLHTVILLKALPPPARQVQQLRIPLRTLRSVYNLKFFLFTQEAPQYGIDQATLMLQTGMALCRLHRLIDQGEAGIAFGVPAALLRLRTPGQNQCAGQQGIQQGRRLFRHQLLAQPAPNTQPAQHLVHQCLHAGAQPGWHLLQCRGGAGAGLHLLNHLGHLLQLLPQRDIPGRCLVRVLFAHGSGFLHHQQKTRTAAAIRVEGTTFVIQSRGQPRNGELRGLSDQSSEPSPTAASEAGAASPDSAASMASCSDSSSASAMARRSASSISSLALRAWW